MGDQDSEGFELQRPMLGAQRHIEARIGQLLGPAPFRYRVSRRCRSSLLDEFDQTTLEA
jgi:hypothetical protein